MNTYPDADLLDPLSPIVGIHVTNMFEVRIVTTRVAVVPFG